MRKDGELQASQEDTQDKWIAEAGTHMATLAKTANCAEEASWRKCKNGLLADYESA